jgi:SAM-dependent methyltransferase
VDSRPKQRTPAGDASDYEGTYRTFDSPLHRALREEAYGEDIGQHSWVTAEELRADVARLRLTREARLIDLGCGPCGPLTYVVQLTGCRGTGAELSAEALEAGRARAAAMGIEHLLSLREADLDERLPFEDETFDGAICLDVVLHLRDREDFFREVRRILRPAGRFLFTDAGVVTGPLTADDIARRGVHGRSAFVPPGINERALERANLRLLEREDRSASAIENASGRLQARLSHRADLEVLEGAAEFSRQQRYLETVVATAQSGALSRIMYLAEAQ